MVTIYMNAQSLTTVVATDRSYRYHIWSDMSRFCTFKLNYEHTTVLISFSFDREGTIWRSNELIGLSKRHEELWKKLPITNVFDVFHGGRLFEWDRWHTSQWRIHFEVTRGPAPPPLIFSEIAHFLWSAGIFFAEFNIHSQAGPPLAEGLDPPLLLLAFILGIFWENRAIDNTLSSAFSTWVTFSNGYCSGQLGLILILMIIIIQ